MTRVMEGVRVLEVAMWGFVPSAGAVLADWGAEVIKVEHPVFGDPMRGMAATGLPAYHGLALMWEAFNRGKRDIGIDISTPDGHEVLMKLVERSDVFLTSFLPDARQKLGIDVADVMARNPRIIYARGSGHGPRGPEAAKGGFDAITYWFRSGASAGVTPPEDEWPARMPAPAFGDVTTGMMLAGGIGTALGHRERTGKGTVVDASLLASALWGMQLSVLGTHATGDTKTPWRGRADPKNPLTNVYRSADGRFIALNVLQADRYWPQFCHALGRDDLITDSRFATHAARVNSGTQIVEILDDVFGSHTLEELTARLATQEGQWDVVRTAGEQAQDEQALANGYIRDVDYPDGASLPMVTPPIQFDETAPDLSAAPELGANTEELLLDLGYDWPDILRMKDAHAIS